MSVRDVDGAIISSVNPNLNYTFENMVRTELANASAADLSPKDIAPPKNSPSRDTTLNVVAVPQSMTMHGPP